MRHYFAQQQSREEDRGAQQSCAARVALLHLIFLAPAQSRNARHAKGICMRSQVASSIIPAQESRVDNQSPDASPLAACNAAALDAVP